MHLGDAVIRIQVNLIIFEFYMRVFPTLLQIVTTVTHHKPSCHLRTQCVYLKNTQLKPKLIYCYIFIVMFFYYMYVAICLDAGQAARPMDQHWSLGQTGAAKDCHHRAPRRWKGGF